MDYFNNKDSLTDIEIEQILADIEEEIDSVNLKEKLDNTNNDDIDNYLLLNAIVQNDYANKKEKEVMYNFIDFFNDNIYLDKEKTYTNLESLEFYRNYNMFSKGKEKEDDIVTIADYYNGKISYYTDVTEDTIAHEVTHAIFDTITIPSAYVEGFAEIIESEYFTHKNIPSNSAYIKNVAVTKATIELIGKDKFLEAMSKDDINIIKNALIDLNNATWIDKTHAVIEIDELFNNLNEGLNNSETYTYIADALISLGNDSYKDIDSFIRLHNYTDVLSSNDIEGNLSYYYFNQQEEKVLSKH